MKSFPMRLADKILLILLGVVSAVFVGLVMILDVLLPHFLLALTLFLLIVLMVMFLLLWRKKSRIAGRIISGLLSVLLGLGCFYVWKTHDTLSGISGADTKVDEIAIVVMAGDLAENIDDIADYRVGIQTVMDRANTDQAVKEIEGHLGGTLNISEYANVDNLVKGLYNGEIQALIMNEAYRGMVEESYESFTTDTRVLSNYVYKTTVEIDKTTGDVTKEPFTVFISGIDVYGSISKTSRSDVNILATVNPNTNQVLLTTTPRDYFVELPFADNARDKLTHSGIYGVDASIETLEHLYGIDIDYYVRVNFTSVENIVDALGGITVDSEKSFSMGEYSFSEGENELSGAEALAFSRERKSFAAGDVQRGRNQMAVIKGIIHKAISPSIIGSYASVLDSVSDSMETNMSTSEITSLVKMQMQTNKGWDIISSNVVGTGSYGSTYSMPGQQLWIMIPDDASVAEAKARIEKVNAGEKLPPVDVAAVEAED